MHITVYLGASCGTDPHLAQAVRELGAWIGAAGHTLVYGGSKTGLMGLLAQSALEQGGSVIGVEPECFMAQEDVYKRQGIRLEPKTGTSCKSSRSVPSRENSIFFLCSCLTASGVSLTKRPL